MKSAVVTKLFNSIATLFFALALICAGINAYYYFHFLYFKNKYQLCLDDAVKNTQAFDANDYSAKKDLKPWEKDYSQSNGVKDYVPTREEKITFIRGKLASKNSGAAESISSKTKSYKTGLAPDFISDQEMKKLERDEADWVDIPPTLDERALFCKEYRTTYDKDSLLFIFVFVVLGLFTLFLKKWIFWLFE